MENKSKLWALWLSLFFGFVVPTLFALDIYVGKTTPNIASWGMFLLLDTIGLFLVYKAGNKKPYLQCGWVLALILIMLAILLSKSTFHFGLIEILSCLAGIVSIYLWITKSAKLGLYPYVVGCYIAFIPQVIDYWTKPQPEVWWVWFAGAAGCIFAIYSAEKKDFANVFVPWAFIPLNLIGFFLVIR